MLELVVCVVVVVVAFFRSSGVCLSYVELLLRQFDRFGSVDPLHQKIPHRHLARLIAPGDAMDSVPQTVEQNTNAAN